MTRSQKQRSKSLKPKPAGRERNLTSEEVRKFQNMIYRYYGKHRRNLPWRLTSDPYHILVSEIMLQQTQVQRVMVKYEQFTRKFPGFHSLASAPLRLILKEWQGLGYNRRALALKRIAQKVMKEFSRDVNDFSRNRQGDRILNRCLCIS